MTDTAILVHRDGAVAEITLNRPEALNAMSAALVDALKNAFQQLSADDTVRAIILTGAGRAFSCGVDLKEISQSPDAIQNFDWHGGASLYDAVHACPHPVISAVNGFAITGGLELALLADFIIASDTAVFADTHARVGITPSWGMTQVLPRLIGINRARQMSLTGEFVDAAKAYDWGLANEIVPADQLMDRARHLARQICETDRSTMTKIRDLIGISAELSLSASMTREAAVFDDHIATVSTKDVAEGRARVTARGRKLAGNETPS